MKIDKLKAKMDEAGLSGGRLPDGGEIVPMCFWSCQSNCYTGCSNGCPSSSCSSGCSGDSCSYGCSICCSSV